MKTMKKTFFVLILMLSAAFMDDYTDVVYLKNGSIIKGIIIEQVIDDYIKIKSGENLFVYKMNEIEKIVKEQVELVEEYSSYKNSIGFLSDGESVIARYNHILNNDLDIGFSIVYTYVDDSLPGDSYVYYPYLSYKFPFNTSTVYSISIGISKSVRYWKGYGLDGVVDNTSLALGFSSEIKLSEKINLSIGLIYAEDYKFNVFNEIYNKEYDFYPIALFSINI